MINNRTFIIAEAGVNHNGSLAKALELIEVAASAKADAVKFQTFRAEDLVTSTAPKADYQKRATGENQSQFEMLKALELTMTDFQVLFDHCQKNGIEFMSTPFDEKSADELESLGMTTFKIPSGELTNHPLIRHIAQKQKLVILSTGMATLDEVHQAVEAIRSVGNTQFQLLHCVSDYPADPATVNLRAMQVMRERFQVPVGLSDHTLGIHIPIAAVAMGASCIEKHFTLDKSLPGPDHQASLCPQEIHQMVSQIRDVESAFGNGIKQPTEAERKTALIARRSVVLARDLPAGHLLTSSDLILRRPGTGFPPSELPYLVNRKLKLNLPKDHILQESDLQ
ncbi:N-acetylneuraminate synthase [Armatimonadetes bacterium Uphvl-Ar1]|nr:N-acetylneuraminate synthase [Armatimonadetes bacterium Uphvl-Ar1]